MPRNSSPLATPDSPSGDLPTLRIANIIEESRYSGPTRRIAIIAEKLRNLGIETVVICARMGSERFCEELTARGIDYRVLPLHRITRNPMELLAAILLFPFELLHLAQLLRSERFDLIHCNGSWQWKGVLAGWLTRTPVVWHLNDTSMPSSIHFVFRQLAKLGANGFIVAGKRTRSHYLNCSRLKSRQVFEIHAPVDCTHFSEKNVRPDPEIASIPGIKVLTIGNISPAKGLETLIRVAARCKNEIKSPVSFIVVGQCFPSQKKYRRDLQELQRQLNVENVYFVGPRSDVLACLRATDVYLCSSSTEASPMAVWEAAAAGLPIVTTDVGDVAQLNTEWKFAHVTATHDVQAITEALRKLATDPLEAKLLGENAKRMARSVFDAEICTRLHAEAYRASVAIPQ